MIINLKSLPIEVYKKIPLSIRTYKQDYELEELPHDIRHLIENHILPTQNIYKTKKIYDFLPVISEYGDLSTVENLISLITSYIQNYFGIIKGNYPFNGAIGSNIKKHLQKRDTVLQNIYMSEEINNMIRSFTTDKDYDIRLDNFNISKSTSFNMVEYTANINLKINDVGKNLSISFIV